MSSEIVLCEAVEIMESLPPQMQQDEQIMGCVLTSLEQGMGKLQVRQDALEIAQMKLQQTVAHGFALVNGQFIGVNTQIQNIKHDAEKDRIHAQYARDDANKARSLAEQAMNRTHEIATMAAVASAKADGATNVAKVASNKSGIAGIDPLMGMAMVSIALVVAFSVMSVKIEKAPPTQQQQSLADELNKFCSTKGNLCAGDGKPSRPVRQNQGI